MITLHKLNGEEFVLNFNNIEIIEERPDTTITLTNERKYIVQEKAEYVLESIVQYQRKVFFRES